MLSSLVVLRVVGRVVREWFVVPADAVVIAVVAVCP